MTWNFINENCFFFFYFFVYSEIFFFVLFICIRANITTTSINNEFPSKSYHQHSNKPQNFNLNESNHKKIPKITADIKASRIYESFRLSSSKDDNNYNDDDVDIEYEEVHDKSANKRSQRSASTSSQSSTTKAYDSSNNRNTSSSSTNSNGKPADMRKRTASSDMLSRNISIILENLLKSYEQSQLPTHGQG